MNVYNVDYDQCVGDGVMVCCQVKVRIRFTVYTMKGKCLFSTTLLMFIHGFVIC